MKIHTRTEWVWNGKEYVVLKDECHEYDGPVAECKGGGLGRVLPFVAAAAALYFGQPELAGAAEGGEATTVGGGVLGTAEGTNAAGGSLYGLGSTGGALTGGATGATGLGGVGSAGLGYTLGSTAATASGMGAAGLTATNALGGALSGGLADAGSAGAAAANIAGGLQAAPTSLSANNMSTLDTLKGVASDIWANPIGKAVTQNVISSGIGALTQPTPSTPSDAYNATPIVTPPTLLSGASNVPGDPNGVDAAMNRPAPSAPVAAPVGTQGAPSAPPDASQTGAVKLGLRPVQND